MSEITTPTVTCNAILLLGYLSASVSDWTRKLDGDEPYFVAEVYPDDGYIVVEHRVTKNRYRVKVEQISGIE